MDLRIGLTLDLRRIYTDHALAPITNRILTEHPRLQRIKAPWKGKYRSRLDAALGTFFPELVEEIRRTEYGKRWKDLHSLREIYMCDKWMAGQLALRCSAKGEFKYLRWLSERARPRVRPVVWWLREDQR